jgi:protein-tyrosine-phosphatase
MAEGFARKLGQDRLEVWSAGSRPAGWVYEGAVEMMKEVGIDISAHRSKGIPDVPAVRWDYVITMGCGDACAAVPAGKRLDWKIPDPVGLSEDEFRAVRDDLQRRIHDLIKQIC